MGVFEVLMLVCFGASWPCNIYKTWTRKSADGKSFPFLCLVIVGYACGIVNKLMVGADWVLLVWILNTALVGVDLGLAVHFLLRARRHAAATAAS